MARAGAQSRMMSGVKRALRWLVVAGLVLVVLMGTYTVLSQTYPFRWNRALKHLPAFNEALLLTLQVAFMGMLFGLALGLVVALARLGLHYYRPAPLPDNSPWWRRWWVSTERLVVTLLHDLAFVYVHTLRNIPFIVFIFFMYFGVGRAVIAPGVQLSLFGMTIDERVLWGTIALGMFEAAFISEIFRAGIQSIHRTQMEAARSMGMNYAQSMRYVILPQAFRNIIPPLSGELIALVKESALLTVISLPELTTTARQLGSQTLLQFEFFIILAIYYLFITIPLSLFSLFLERKLNIHRQRV